MLIDRLFDSLFDHWVAWLLTLVLLITLFVWAGGCGKQHFIPAKVLQTSYAPSTVGFGTGIGSKGQVVSTTIVTPEQFIVILQFSNGEVSSADVSSSAWAHLHSGDSVTADVRWWGIAEVRLEQ